MEKIKEHIRGLMNEERFTHSLGVMELSGELARIYGVEDDGTLAVCYATRAVVLEVSIAGYGAERGLRSV